MPTASWSRRGVTPTPPLGPGGWCARLPDYTLQSLNAWDTLGMRGTCSNGFRVEAAGHVEQILPVPFGEIADLTMTPVSHMLWSAMWIGIAGDALQRAKGFFQGQARARPGALPPSAAWPRRSACCR